MSGGGAVVIGLGRSGVACTRVLAAEGWRVAVVDAADTPRLRDLAATLPAAVEVRLGVDDASVVDGAALVCPSPGVAWDHPALARARAAGIPVRSEIALAFERCPGPIVGVTGTNGKTTTTALLGAVLAEGGARVHVGGNIGDTILDRLDGVGAEDWVVLELSSFQLESVERPRCRLATVLNLSPDHLDRHGSMAAYTLAKRRIVEHADPDGSVALNGGDPAVRGFASHSAAPVTWFGRELDADLVRGHAAATVRDADVIISDPGGRRTPLLPVADIPLLGAHNVDNVLAAVALGAAAGVDPGGMARAVRGFRAVHHRLEPVLDAAGVLWVDDSKATNVDAAVTALRAFDRPIVWIGGGGRKGVGPEELCAAVAARARTAVLNGATGPELDAELERIGYPSRVLVPDLRAAVETAGRLARPGDVVLLAPGYTSFDQFASYEERGLAFAGLVRALATTVPD